MTPPPWSERRRCVAPASLVSLLFATAECHWAREPKPPISSQTSCAEALSVTDISTVAMSPSCRERSSRADLGTDDHTPGLFADRHRLEDTLIGDVNDRDVVADAVGRDQTAFVCIKGEVPDALSDQQIAFHLVGLCVDERDAVRRPERDEGPVAVMRQDDANRLYRLARNTWYGEFDPVNHLALCGIDDADRAAHLRGDPDLDAIRRPFGMTGPPVDEHVGDNLVRQIVDEMRHAGRLGGIDDPLAIGADADALGLDANRDLADDPTLLDVDDRH